ncbi:MAG: hypothetical protein KDC24_11225, partial [Saprospiraceae bacterium]|nr:hypothetical protein [Saprospiraceae bacterium]
MKTDQIFPFIFRLFTAGLFLMFFYLHFTANPNQRHIFFSIGRFFFSRGNKDVAEIITAIMILIPPIAWLGAIAGIIFMSGAMTYQLSVYGTTVPGNGSLLFELELTAIACCFGILWIHRKEIILGKMIAHIKSRLN